MKVKLNSIAVCGEEGSIELIRNKNKVKIIVWDGDKKKVEKTFDEGLDDALSDFLGV